MLFTSPFFENTRLSAIAFTERRSSIAHHQPITIIQPTPNLPPESPRRRKPRESRQSTYRDRVRMQREQLFNQVRRIHDEEDEPFPLAETDFPNTDQSFYFTAPNGALSSFEQLIAQKPSDIPFTNNDHHPPSVDQESICRYQTEAVLTIDSPPTVATIPQPHRRDSTSNSPNTTRTTLSISAPSSVRLGLIPRRLDRSQTSSLHGSSMNSLNISHDSADSSSALTLAIPPHNANNNDNDDDERRQQYLVTTVSLLAIGFAFVQKFFDL